jgi:hypothetical protein
MVFIAIVFYVFVALILAAEFSEVASEKGYTSKKYYWICLLLGIAGYILVCALPDRGNRTSAISDELPDL